MVDEDSEIIDFYPKEFAIDMNGHKMIWQGVALLPFIDQNRLLAALQARYPQLTEEEVIRNSRGSNYLYVSEDSPLYDSLLALYNARKPPTEVSKVSGQVYVFLQALMYIYFLQPVRLDTKRSARISGFVLPDSNCVPGSTYFSPLASQNLGDINNDRSVSVIYSYPKQLTPHRSVLLPGVQPGRPMLTPYERDVVRRGGKHDSGAGNGFHAQRREMGGPGISRFDRGDGYRGPPKRSFSSGRGGGGGGGGGPYNRDPYQGYDAPHGGYAPYGSVSAEIGSFQMCLCACLLMWFNEQGNSGYGGRGMYDSQASGYGAWLSMDLLAFFDGRINLIL
jgi:5'-3' exoribonuclease 2